MTRPLPITAVQAAPAGYDATATYQKFETKLAKDQLDRQGCEIELPMSGVAYRPRPNPTG